MTWGMFLSIPCPFRRWDERARGNMMVCLPFIGAVVGGILGFDSLDFGNGCMRPTLWRHWLLAALPLAYNGLDSPGRLHGCCDAVLSRRDLDTRRKILKDSHCGAFAVISLVLLALAQWSFFLSADRVALLPLALIPVATRACAGLAVVSLRPIETSQYASMDRQGRAAKQAALWVISYCLWGFPCFRSGWAGCAPLAAAARCSLAVRYGFRQLQGMSGDISGFALTLGRAGRRCSF